MRHFLRHEPSCGIGGATDKRGAFARRAAVPSGGNAVNVTEDVRKYAAEQVISEEEALLRGMDEKSKAFVESGAEVVRGREQKIILLEVANEAWQNGFPGEEGVRDLREFTTFLADRTAVPVATTSNHEDDFAKIYANSTADIATWHFSRDLRTDDGWKPVYDCWDFSDMPGFPPASSNEPIGPGSSVSSETDPIKLCSAAAFAYLANLPAYVFHSSAGVYARDRFEVTPGIGAFRHLRRILPPDLANWERNDGIEAQSPFTVFCNGLPNRYWPDVEGATNGCHRNIGSAKGREFVCYPMGILAEGVTLEARRSLRFQVVNPLTGVAVSNQTLAAGQRFTVPQGPGAYLLEGRFE